MNRLVVLAACMCSASAQLVPLTARAYAAAPVPVQQSHQFHAQDEFGQYTFGYAGGPSARTESRDAYGVTRGSFQSVSAAGGLAVTHYESDPINGFRIISTNTLPVAPAAPAVAPLAGPVFDLVGPAPVEDTPEVAAAKAEFQAAFDAAAAAAAAPQERKRRQAILPATAAAGLPLAGLGLGLPYAAGIAAPLALPAGTPAGVLAAGPYNAVSAPAGREAVLTTIKLNPGHATFYRVD